MRNGPIARKLRGMAILFQEEMTLDARKPGFVPRQNCSPGGIPEVSGL